MPRNLLGKQGEDAAERFLRNLGFEILSRNFNTKIGEIDIIAKDGNTIVFVEVKSRSGLKFGTPSEAIGYKKLQAIVKTSQLFLKTKHWENAFIRYDALEIISENGEFSIHHIRNIML